MDRRSLMGKIHIAKKVAYTCPDCNRVHFGDYCPDCGNENPVILDDAAYRKILILLTNHSSCAHMSENDLKVVADYFDRAGFKEAHPFVSVKAEARKQRRKVLFHIYKVAPQILGENWESRIEGFVQSKVGKSRLDWCDAEELRKVIGWIHRYQKYNERRI